MRRLAKETKMKNDLTDIEEPTHYARWPVEPVEVIMQNGLEFWRGNIIKYVMRAGYKQGSFNNTVQAEISDLMKAKRYIEMRINQLEGKNIVTGK
jgi:hypothetical protein